MLVFQCMSFGGALALGTSAFGIDFPPALVVVGMRKAKFAVVGAVGLAAVQGSPETAFGVCGFSFHPHSRSVSSRCCTFPYDMIVLVLLRFNWFLFLFKSGFLKFPWVRQFYHSEFITVDQYLGCFYVCFQFPALGISQIYGYLDCFGLELFYILYFLVICVFNSFLLICSRVMSVSLLRTWRANSMSHLCRAGL